MKTSAEVVEEAEEPRLMMMRRYFLDLQVKEEMSDHGEGLTGCRSHLSNGPEGLMILEDDLKPPDCKDRQVRVTLGGFLWQME